MYPISSDVNLPLFLLTVFAFQSVSLSVSSWACFPPVFHFLTVLFYASILLFLSLLHFASQACKKTSFSEKAQIRAFKHPNACEITSWMSTLSDISYIVCGWIHRYSETIKCFLHCATYLKSNKQTEKNYF